MELSETEKEALNKICNLYKNKSIPVYRTSLGQLILIVLDEHVSVSFTLQSPFQPRQTYLCYRVSTDISKIVPFYTSILDKRTNQLTNQLDRLALHYYRPSNRTLFLSKQIDLLRLHKEAKSQSINHKLLGKVYGIPESAIQSYTTGTKASDIQEYIQSETPWRYENYKSATKLTYYVPPATIEGLTKALTLSKQRYQVISNLSISEESYPELFNLIDAIGTKYRPRTDPTIEEFKTNYQT